ncbi:MAG: hypothetical protein GY869_11720, partial [Planctomycetes bacterium]|nr:hypothetical protein [Planctomycetota bacterium]
MNRPPAIVELPEKYQKKQAGPDQRPNDWAFRQRTFPYGTADPRAYSEMIAEAKVLRAEHSSGRDLTWEFAGPANIGGRFSHIAINPQDTDIVYAGAVTGGVFKSIDGGWTWLPVFDDQAIITIGSIAIDPLNPDVIYAGTGEANGGHNNLSGGGIYKSTDAGQSWVLLGLDDTYMIERIVIDPIDSDRVYVAAPGAYFAPATPNRGVYRSTNGGIDWEQSLFVSDSTGAVDLVINPQNPSILYAAMWERISYPNVGSHRNGPTSGMYKTTDGGDSWFELTRGLPDPAENIGRIGLTICQSQPDVLYALYNDGSYLIGLYRTDDGGENWHQTDPSGQINEGSMSFSWYFGNVRVHPTDPDKVFVLDVFLMGSEDGGITWPIFYGYYPSYPGLHVDQHALEFFPDNPDKIIEGNDGGLNISEDGGFNWTKIAELPVTQFYEIEIDYNNPDRLYGGTQDNGTLRTLTGATDDWHEIYGGDGMYCIVDYSNSDIIYAESQYGYLGKSTDGGYSFDYGMLNGIDGNEPTNWSTPVVMDPVDHEVLYYGTDRLYRTTNGANLWQPISPVLAEGVDGGRLETISTIA